MTPVETIQAALDTMRQFGLPIEEDDQDPAEWRAICEAMAAIKSQLHKAEKAEAVTAAAGELVSDINSMVAYRDCNGAHLSPGWYGAFDESQAGYAAFDVLIEWPNLAISTAALKQALEKP